VRPALEHQIDVFDGAAHEQIAHSSPDEIELRGAPPRELAGRLKPPRESPRKRYRATRRRTRRSPLLRARGSHSSAPLKGRSASSRRLSGSPRIRPGGINESRPAWFRGET